LRDEEVDFGWQREEEREEDLGQLHMRGRIRRLLLVGFSRAHLQSLHTINVLFAP